MGRIKRDPFCARGESFAPHPQREHPNHKEDAIATGGRLIGYARVSTQEQTLSLQLDALQAAGCIEIFKDQGVSGAKQERPGLDAAFAELKAGDCLVVWKLDRLGRSLRHLIDTLKMLSERGVGFRSIQDAIDTTTAGGRLYFHIMGALAEFERDLISERTKAGMAAAKARGVHVGRPPREHANQRGELALPEARGSDENRT